MKGVLKAARWCRLAAMTIIISASVSAYPRAADPLARTVVLLIRLRHKAVITAGR